MCTITQIEEMSDEIKGLIGYSLMAKINGRILRHSMRAATTDLKKAEAGGIDGINDVLSELDELAQSNEWFANAGLNKEVKTDLDILTEWLHTRVWLVDNGFQELDLMDSFKYILTQEREKRSTSEDELAQMARLSGMSENVIAKSLQLAADKAMSRTKTTVFKALEIVSGIERPMWSGTGDTGMFRPPEDLKEMVYDAIQSGKKAALRSARSTKEALGALMLLKVEEDFT